MGKPRLAGTRIIGIFLYERLFPVIWASFAIATLIVVFPIFAAAEDQTQSVQGPSTQVPEPDEGLRERLKSLERTVEELKKDRGSPKVGESNVKPEEGYQRPTAGTSTEVPEHERERGMLRQDNYADPRIDNAPFDPQLRGFFRLPGTETMLRLGGFARTDVIHDFSPAGNTAKFVTSSIPTGPNPGSDNTSMSVAPSRISFKIRNNTKYGPLRRISS